MVSLKLSPSDYNRSVAKQARVVLRNRYFEQNPVLSTDEVSLLARPGRKKYLEVGTGPIRAIYEAPGAFDRIFVVSGQELYAVDPLTDTASLIGTLSSDTDPTPSMAACAAIGDTVPAHLFIADGIVLWNYTEDGYATGHLLASSIADTETVEVGGTYYKFTSGSVDSGTPDGTSGTPWLVALGGSVTESIDNLANALNATGTLGTTYSSALTANGGGLAYSWSGGNMYIRAVDAGVIGNGITTTETGANMAWGAGTLSGGGSPSFLQTRVPDDIGAVSVAHINSYIIVIPTQDGNVNGRFYWINPGEIKIDPLSYATAERSPDAILQCVVFSDQVWFCGQNTTEAWVPSGDPDAPFVPFHGVLFDRGVWEGTAVQVKESLILVDNDGAVFQIAGGLKKISRPDIQERIRLAIQANAV